MRHYAKLLSSSLRIIRSEGYKAFATYLMNWIKGKRGAYQPGEWPHFPTITYDDYWRERVVTTEHIAQQKEAMSLMEDKPTFIIITKASDYDDIFQRLSNSRVTVLEQAYKHWVWYIMCEESQKEALAGIALADSDHIFLINSHDEITSSEKDKMIFFLEENDQLSPDCLYLLAEEYNQTRSEIIYTDYDYIVPGVEHFDHPLFKPDWSPELMLSFNVLRHLGCYSWEIWKKYGPDIDCHDFAFKASENSTKITHIPRVLYHRQIKHRTADYQMPSLSVASHLERKGLKNVQVDTDSHRAMKVSWEIPSPSPISIIIPSRDQPELIARCLASIFSKTDYPTFEVILVDTGSQMPETQTVYDRYLSNPKFKLVNFSEEFNFSRVCNFGAEHVRGNLLLFLNNDTEILHHDWLYLMAQWFELPDIGIVGSKLLYPDGRIQHMGHIIGLFGLAAHIMQGSPEHTMTIFGSDDWYRNYQAVTGACLMIPKTVFDEIGGFDETYQLNYSDVELCFAVREAGYRIVYTPHVRLIHNESATHQKRVPIKDTKQFHGRLHPINEDPFFNPNLTYQSILPALKRHKDDSVETFYQTRTRMIQEALEAENNPASKPG